MYVNPGIGITRRWQGYLIEPGKPVQIGDSMFKRSQYDFSIVPDDRELFLADIEKDDEDCRYIPIPIMGSNKVTLLKRL